VHTKFQSGNLKGKDPLGRPRRRWVDNIRLGHKETWLTGVNLMHLAQDRAQSWALMSTAMNLLVP